MLCEICKRSKHHYSTFPDFCDDLNAAQRLVKHTINATDYSYYGETLIDVAWEREADTSAWLIEETLQLPAKTITLACLVALDKITLEEAKESL